MEIERDVANKKDVKNPTLEEFGINLTIKAINGELDKVFGRENELEDLIKILSRKKKNNAIMVSYPGVGKTSMVFLLAQRIVEQKVPTGLLNKVIYSLDSASLTAGTKYRGEMEERVKKILKEAEEDENIILFIDEIHTILDSSGNNAMNISNIMKPHLTSGKLQVAGATTFDEFSKFFEKDSALSRRFNRLTIEEPSIEACEVIIKQCIGSYEKFHNVNFSDEIIKQIPILAKKYIKDRYLPDSAIDIVDELGAKIKVERTKPSNKLLKMLDEMEENQKVKLELIKNEDWETISTFKPQVLDKLKNKITYEQEKFNERINNSDRIEITQEDLLKVVSKISKVDLSKLHENGGDIIKNLEKVLNEELINQDEAKTKILKVLKKNILGFNNPTKPLCSIYMNGVSGSGKTFFVKLVAKALGLKLITINCAELGSGESSISKLSGSNAGYIGHGEQTVLDKVKNDPNCILLWDEFDKISPNLYPSLLSILDEGILIDNKNERINFENTYMFFTSNDAITELNYVKPGFGAKESNEVNIKSTSTDVIRKKLPPELYNRFSDFITFDVLKKPEMILVVEAEINNFKKILKAKGIVLTVNKNVKEFIADKYTDTKLGARPIKRGFETSVIEVVSDFLIENLDNNIKKINVIMNEINDGVIVK